MAVNNKKTIIYLLINVLIWGYFVIRFMNMGGGDESNIPSITTQRFIPDEIEKKEQFDLLAVERDPFLGTFKKKSSGVKRVSKKAEPLNWPSLSYLGMVEDGKGKAKVFILQINGQQHLMSPNETIADLRLLRGNSEKITIKYKGQSKEISL